MSDVIVGIDEVGRGCWAGPVVSAAVVLHRPIDGLADSKLLTKLRRQELANQIYQNGSVGLGWISPASIDKLGLTTAITLTMQSALQQIQTTKHYDTVIIDGNFNFLQNCPQSPRERTDLSQKPQNNRGQISLKFSVKGRTFHTFYEEVEAEGVFSTVKPRKERTRKEPRKERARREVQREEVSWGEQLWGDTREEVMEEGNGLREAGPECVVRCVVGADRTVPAVSAASIVAKVARDNYMAEMALKFPHYGFEKHVGYGTKHHREMLKLHGACRLHRFSYKPLESFKL